MTFCMATINQTNLNEGTGKLCAGQDKLMTSPERLSKIEPLDSWANLGLAPPIGSVHFKEILSTQPDSPKCWNGLSLSRTQKWKWLVLIGFKGSQSIWICWELRHGHPNGLYNRKESNLCRVFYLNEGRGVPWAGHVMARPRPEDLVKADDSKMEENFGLVDPIGSNDK